MENLPFFAQLSHYLKIRARTQGSLIEENSGGMTLLHRWLSRLECI